LAEYRDYYLEFEKIGAKVVALSVDNAERSESLRQQLGLPFEILCDPSRETIKAWGLFNAKEKGGIAIPATFIIDRDLTVLHSWVEQVGARVAPTDVLSVLRSKGAQEAVAAKPVRPGIGFFAKAIANALRGGVRSPQA
jgi:peroxiredoxin